MSLTATDLGQIKHIVDESTESLARIVNKGFLDVDKRFEKVDKRLDRMDKRFEKIDHRFDKVESTLSEIRTKQDFGQRIVREHSADIAELKVKSHTH